MNENNSASVSDTRKVIKISRRKFITISVIIIVVAVLWILGTKMFSQTYMSAPASQPIPNFGSASTKSSPAMIDAYYPGYQQQPDITDTREFLKTTYSATIKTRDVAGVVKEVKNTVKGADGRIDELNSSEKSGQIRFVVAKDKFDAFRDEIEAITNKKLYTESISSQNLLSQKQNIEEQTKNVVTTLDSLKSQKDALTAKHTQTVSTINNEISRIQTQLVTVRANIANTSDTLTIRSLRDQETSLVNQDSAQRQKLTSENNSYAAQKQNRDNQISNLNNSLTNINKQDTQFTNNVETVNGYVMVNWISLWDLATIFSPISPVIIIIILVIILLFYLQRSRFVPRIEWQ